MFIFRIQNILFFFFNGLDHCAPPQKNNPDMNSVPAKVSSFKLKFFVVNLNIQFNKWDKWTKNTQYYSKKGLPAIIEHAKSIIFGAFTKVLHLTE